MAAEAQFTVAIHERKVPVTAEPGIDRIPEVLEAPCFRDWQSQLSKEFTVRGVHIQSVDWFGPRVGFLKLKLDIQVDGVNVPGVVFFRGGAVAILPILTCGSEQHVLLTVQPRVPVGNAALVELPAGMLDGSGHFGGVAAKEMEEETGIAIDASELIDMTELAYGPSGAVYPSPGGCDETLRFFLYRKSVTPAQLEELQGKLTGLRHEGELITLRVEPLGSVWRATRDMKALSALQLYERLSAEGLIPPYPSSE